MKSPSSGGCGRLSLRVKSHRLQHNRKPRPVEHDGLAANGPRKQRTRAGLEPILRVKRALRTVQALGLG
jgi:hypothetical protein